jgi:hypothetical protein
MRIRSYGDAAPQSRLNDTISVKRRRFSKLDRSASIMTKYDYLIVDEYVRPHGKIWVMNYCFR